LPGDSDGGILTGPGHVSLSSLSGSERDITYLYGIPLHLTELLHVVFYFNNQANYIVIIQS